MHTRIASGVLMAAILVFSVAMIAAAGGLASAQSETRGQAWSSINSAMGSAESTFEADMAAALAKVDEAEAKYDSVFRDAAFEVDPATGEEIDQAFVDIRAGIEGNSKIDVVLNKQVIDKLIYKISFMKIEQSLDAAESSFLRDSMVSEAASWFTVMTIKFRYDQTPSEASEAMAELQNEPDEFNELAPVIIDGLKAQFTLKVKEEVEEAVGALEASPPDTFNAQKFTQEGIMYYRTIQPDVTIVLGPEEEEEISHEFEELMQASAEGDVEAAEHASEEITTLMLEYEGKETSGIGGAISTLVDMLRLADAEYSAAVADGEIIDQQEYDEAVLFLDRAVGAFEEAEVQMLEVAPSETQEVKSNLATLAELIETLADPAEVTEVVMHALHELDEVFVLGVEESKGLDGWGYIDHIHELLDEVVEQYSAGNLVEAREIAIEAYLDNYEFIEADIAEEDRPLMEKIEIDMRVELVRMIDQDRPASEVEAHVEQIKTDLEVARAVVTPEFPLAAISAVLALSGTVAYTRYRTSFGRRA